MSRDISNSDSVIDSRDIIARIEELQADREEFTNDLTEAREEYEAADVDQRMDGELGDAVVEAEQALAAWSESEEGIELKVLEALASEGEGSPDWQHGETLISETYFTKYIEELIDDCYELPKAMNSGEWPWRHMKFDFEAAAEEAKADYMEVDYDGVTYLLRA